MIYMQVLLWIIVAVQTLTVIIVMGINFLIIFGSTLYSCSVISWLLAIVKVNLFLLLSQQIYVILLR